MPNDDAEIGPDITVTDELDAADVAVITDGLRAYDLSQTGYYDFRPLAVVVRDPQTGKVVGGIKLIGQGDVWVCLGTVIRHIRLPSPRHRGRA